MDLILAARARIKDARRRGAGWVRVLDNVKPLLTLEGRSQITTLIRHRDDVHQTTTYTREDRYPQIFDLAVRLLPEANRILSFGCSTGEELVTLRRRFPGVEIIGAEINFRARRIAKRKIADDARIKVVAPNRLKGEFDLIFALAVLQREPFKVDEADIRDLSAIYPFKRFDAAISRLVGMLSTEGVICVANSQYRVEDSRAATLLEPIPEAPVMTGKFFSRNSRLLEGATACTVFRKRRSASEVVNASDVKVSASRQSPRRAQASPK
jgi:hypothetical protein